MKNLLPVGPWVVYQATVREQTEGPNVVCGQAEWDALELAQPGYHRLIRAGIAHEGEAERLARGTSGDPIPRGPKPAGRGTQPPRGHRSGMGQTATTGSIAAGGS